MRGRSPGPWLRARGREVRAWLALSVGLGVVAGLAVIAQAGLIAHVVHVTLIDHAPLAHLAGAFSMLVAAVALRAVADWGRQAAGIGAAARVRRRVRADLVDRLGRLGPGFVAGHHSGAIATRVVEQVDALDGYFARFLPQVALAVLVPLLVLAAVSTQDWLAALLLLASAPLIPLFMALVGMGAEQLNRRQFEIVRRLSGHFLDRVRGLSTLRLFGAAPRAVDEVAAAADAYRQRSMRTLRVAFLSSAVLEFFSSVAIAVVAIYVGFGLLGYLDFGPAPRLTLFSGLFVLLLAPEFFQPLRSLAQHFHDRASARAAAADLLEILGAPAAAWPDAPPGSSRPRALRLAGVDAAYPDGTPVLRGIDLDIAVGSRVAVTGPSGCGKTTLLQVVAGFMAPAAGRVELEGRPAGIPGDVAWMGQRTFLLQATIADNIRLARPGASDEEVRAAAEAAGAGDFLPRLPAGLDTPVGERGYGLSGGQARRVALARVFLSDARVLLLDEPTASLDGASEDRVLAALDRLAASGRTLLIATHHARVRALADRVLVIGHGRLVEEPAGA